MLCQSLLILLTAALVGAAPAPRPIAAPVPKPIAMPQGVTAAISPTGMPPPGCMISTASSFGIAAMNVTSMGMRVRAVSEMPDGQPTETPAPAVTEKPEGQPNVPSALPAITEKPEGQPNVPTGTVAPLTQISDGQIQGTSGMIMVTMMPVSQIHDGQIQAIYEMTDGQPNVIMTTAAVTEKPEGQPNAPPATTGAVTEKPEGQPNAPTSTGLVESSEGQPSQPMATGTMMVGCMANDTLTLTLSDGKLMDSQGRTGYIASNFQFQFDKPAQAGAIYTAGWSVCANGSLALGGSNIFYQCLSGSFYNLYDRKWAPQCSPVTLQTLMLISC